MAGGFYIDATQLLATFGTKLTVYPATKDGGEWADGQWVPDEPEAVEVTEPFVPQGRIGQYSTMLALRDTGKVERYTAEWLSAGSYEMGTVVEHQGKRLVVADKDDYTDYSNLTVYYLAAETDDQLKEGDD